MSLNNRSVSVDSAMPRTLYRGESLNCLVQVAPATDALHPAVARRWMHWDVAHRFRLLGGGPVAMVATGTVLVRGESMPIRAMPTKAMPAVEENPMDVGRVIEAQGADAVRLALAYLAPVCRAFEWDERYVRAASAWLARFEALADATGMAPPGDSEGLAPDALALRREAWLGLAAMAARYRLADELNEVLSRAMTLLARVESSGRQQQSQAVRAGVIYLVTVALWPILPATCERIWQRHVGGDLAATGWPDMPGDALDPVIVELAIEVNGQVRGRLEVRPGVSRDEVLPKALAIKNVQRYLAARQPRKIVFIADKLINFVVN